MYGTPICHFKHNAMKGVFISLAVLCISGLAWAQENRIKLSAGYVFENIEEIDTDASGFRINGIYEFNPNEGIYAHGIAFGYARTSATYTSFLQTTDYKFNTIPVYYAPKVIFGKGAFRGYLKGAIGLHFMFLNRTGALGDLSDSDMGFYGGASAGLMYQISDKIFADIEYEWAYVSNTFYRDAFINSAMAGIGFRF